MVRLESDRKRWALIDSAVEGKQAVLIVTGVHEAHRELSVFLRLVETHGVEISKYSRSRVTIEFPSGGSVIVISSRQVKTAVVGRRLDTAVTTTTLSHWDRADITASGATFI